MTLPSVLLLFLGAAMVSSASVLSPQYTWKKIILTHHWPKTFCDMEHCHPNPPKLNYWTVHGLWPDKGQFCNSSWTFNSSLVEDLMPDMEKSWPDLIKPNTTGFWKYEWSKHGTCAAQEEIMNSQHKYFSKGLELYHKVDLDSVLKKLNITPSAQYYNFAAIESAIENFYGVKPKIQCAHPTKEKDSQTLAQIEICFNHDMTFLNCEKESVGKGVTRPSALGVCDHNIPVYYPPLSLSVQ